MSDPDNADFPGTIPVGTAAVADAGLLRAGEELRSLVSVVRAKLRDYPQLNRLTAGVEHSDRQIALALVESLTDWNATPPLLDAVTFSSHPSIPLLIDRAIVSLLYSLGLLQTRNQLRYSDGQGQQVSISDKGDSYRAWAAMFEQGYENKKQRIKIAQNLGGGLNGSGVASELALVNSLFGGE
jgi:hypothetical protein